MTKEFFVLSCALYWVSFLLRLVLWTRPQRRIETTASAMEKVAMLVFTTAIVLYIGRLQIVNGQVHSEFYDRPISFLLFAWAVSAAQMVTDVAYSNKRTALFAHFWTALALTISSSTVYEMKDVFTSDLEWLSFHRLCYLLGYAFCVLAFPLVLRYLSISLQLRRTPMEKAAPIERDLWRIDRMGYRMVLWALPILTAGIIAEVLLLIETHQLPTVEQLWTERQESLLALTAWFLCGIYLHTRLFFGWRNLRAASLYLVGLLLLVVGHFSHTLSGRAP